ncbi:MAG: 2' O-ribose methyltransferase [Stictis urceolatum]|nr:2' O-ribose methyltransferase [Stictis urceolata]
MQMNEKYKIFKKGQTVVDLGFAPGSWSQVAADRTSPNGRVIGIDIIPAQPPKGVSTIQGNFLSPAVREEVKRFLKDPEQGRPKEQKFLSSEDKTVTEDDLNRAAPKPLESEDLRLENDTEAADAVEMEVGAEAKKLRMVDVVLSDMSAPWEQTTGFRKRSLSDPYYRMVNTSGMSFRDHAGSMDLCNAALLFAFDTLRPGGTFVAKFYQGAEDKALEKSLKALFTKVHREKPDSSRKESKEAYFVALKRKKDVECKAVFV